MKVAFQTFIAVSCNPNWNNRTNEKNADKFIQKKDVFFCHPEWRALCVFLSAL